MDINVLKAFFMWCTIINMGFMIFAFVVMILISDLAYRIHSKWFPMSRETFNVVIYSFFGVYKIGVFLFCLAPYITLIIMTRPAV